MLHAVDVSLEKPLGLVLEENVRDAPEGLYVAEIDADGSASGCADIKVDDHLDAVNGVDTTLIASSPDGAMQPGQRLTFQAWIHPLELNRGQVLAMMGSNGWALMLTCNEGSGSACCGDCSPSASATGPSCS